MKRVLKESLVPPDQNEEKLRDLFFYKFLGFRNDKEVRLLTIDHSNQGNVKDVHVEVCSLVKDVMFDPRMPEDCFEESRAKVDEIYRSRGKSVTIRQSSLYAPKKHLGL